jgi:hypothetical protein
MDFNFKWWKGGRAAIQFAAAFICINRTFAVMGQFSQARNPKRDDHEIQKIPESK